MIGKVIVFCLFKYTHACLTVYCSHAGLTDAVLGINEAFKNIGGSKLWIVV